MTRVRAVVPVDAIGDDDERVVLLDGRAVRVSGIAPAVLDLAEDWIELVRLTAVLEDLLGPGPQGGALALVEAAVEQLAEVGLVVLEP